MKGTGDAQREGRVLPPLNCDHEDKIRDIWNFFSDLNVVKHCRCAFTCVESVMPCRGKCPQFTQAVNPSVVSKERTLKGGYLSLVSMVLIFHRR